MWSLVGSWWSGWSGCVVCGQCTLAQSIGCDDITVNVWNISVGWNEWKSSNGEKNRKGPSVCNNYGLVWLRCYYSDQIKNVSGRSLRKRYANAGIAFDSIKRIWLTLVEWEVIYYKNAKLWFKMSDARSAQCSFSTAVFANSTWGFLVIVDMSICTRQSTFSATKIKMRIPKGQLFSFILFLLLHSVGSLLSACICERVCLAKRRQAQRSRQI